ncbi:MAG: hypothetical protein AAFU55_17665, partial [Pseudomonadota bacterium]
GASIATYKIAGQTSTLVTINLIKIVIFPLITFGFAVYVFELPPLWTAIAVLFAAMPVGGWARAAEWQRGRFKAALGSSVSELGGVAAFGKRALDALSFSSRRIKELEARIEALEAKVLTHESREENAAEREAA